MRTESLVADVSIGKMSTVVVLLFCGFVAFASLFVIVLPSCAKKKTQKQTEPNKPANGDDPAKEPGKAEKKTPEAPPNQKVPAQQEEKQDEKKKQEDKKKQDMEKASKEDDKVQPDKAKEAKPDNKKADEPKKEKSKKEVEKPKDEQPKKEDKPQPKNEPAKKEEGKPPAAAAPPAQAPKPVVKTIRHDAPAGDKDEKGGVITNPFITEVSDEFPTVEETK